MFRKMMVVLFMLLLPFGAMACGEKPVAVPTSTVSYEIAMEAITELSDKMKDGEERLTELEKGTDSSVLERLTAMEATVKKIEEFRTENPGHFGRVTDTTFVDKLKFECTGSVPGFGLRDLFRLGGRTLFCTQPGVSRPADGSVCFNIPGTKFWDCGYGQILRECIDCGCGTPTTAPPTDEPKETATPKPQDTPNVVTATPKPQDTPNVVTATPKPQDTPKPVPTNAPPPEGTVCIPCITPYEVDDLTGHGDFHGYWIKETPKECAFEHHAIPGTFAFVCPPEFICTVDTTTDFFVVEGAGQSYPDVYRATVRWMPWYPDWEGLDTVYEGEYCFATKFAPAWREGRNLRAEDARGNEMKFPTPSPERCAIRNAP